MIPDYNKLDNGNNVNLDYSHCNDGSEKSENGRGRAKGDDRDKTYAIALSSRFIVRQCYNNENKASITTAGKRMVFCLEKKTGKTERKSTADNGFIIRS